jgi:hypothetical protein
LPSLLLVPPSDSDIAGQDATEAFFGLHRSEVLLKPAYARLQIGKIKGQTKQILYRQPGETRTTPYAEPSWLTPVYHSPYYNDSHRALQKAMRKLVDEVIYRQCSALVSFALNPSR